MAALPPNFTLLQVIPDLETGGAEQATLDVARAVVQAGGRAIVASRGGRMADELATRGGELVTLPVHSKNPLTMLGNRGRLARLIRDERVSLVHVRSRAPAFAAFAAARLAGVPCLATYHGLYNSGNPLKRWYNSVMTRGPATIANSWSSPPGTSSPSIIFDPARANGGHPTRRRLGALRPRQGV